MNRTQPARTWTGIVVAEQSETFLLELLLHFKQEPGSHPHKILQPQKWKERCRQTVGTRKIQSMNMWWLTISVITKESTSRDIREINFWPIKLAKNTVTVKIPCWWKCGDLGALGAPLWTAVWQYVPVCSMCVACDLVIPLQALTLGK